uniref:hypothetical protein n=1 Tax=Flavobacterium sp. TaxID=239 RepID=UPI0040496B0D
MPKLFFPLLQLIYGLGLLTVVIFGIYKFTNDFKIDLLIQGILFLSFMGLFSFNLIYSFLYYIKVIRFEENFITIFELHKLKKTKINYSEIQGFSTSEVYFGRIFGQVIRLLFIQKQKKTIEILSNYNSSFEKLEQELKKRELKYYGFEEYNTGWYFRKYKFNGT